MARIFPFYTELLASYLDEYLLINFGLSVDLVTWLLIRPYTLFFSCYLSPALTRLCC